MRVIRPVMSALTSTFFLGWILPLAVTAATRSRRPTCSNRTSIPFSRLALALTMIRTTTSAPTPTPKNTLFRLDMSDQSSRLTQTAADGGFQQRQGLVVVVRRVHGIALGTQRGDLRVQQLEKRSRADAVALGRELELLPRGGAVRVLQSHRAERGLQRQERLAHFRLHGETARAHGFLEIPVLRPRLRDTRFLSKVGKDRQRHRQARLERLARKVEREDRIAIADVLLG